MSHPTTLWHVLWDTLRTLYRNLRRELATSEEHSGMALVVNAPAPEVEAALGRHYFAPNWEFSYHERGEDLNLARIVYDTRTAKGHEYVWWQTHVRGWKQDDGSIRLRPHYELEPTEYDQDHVNGVGLNVSMGVERVEGVLDDASLDYERFDHLPAGGER
ncbi:MAG: hypothetical protein ABEJ58_07880 [Halodesulfurarchaeum sp.]